MKSLQLTLETIDKSNLAEALELRVKDDQLGFVDSVKDCLYEADHDERWQTFGLRDGAVMVGFAMCGSFSEKGEEQVWLDRFLIDQRYQHRGYGKKALALLCTRLAAEYRCKKIYLSVYKDNAIAIELYLNCGFAFNGDLDINGELVMIKDL